MGLGSFRDPEQPVGRRGEHHASGMPLTTIQTRRYGSLCAQIPCSGFRWIRVVESLGEDHPFPGNLLRKIYRCEYPFNDLKNLRYCLILSFRAVIVAQMAQWLLPIQEVLSENPDIDKI